MMTRWRTPLVQGSLLLMETLWIYALVAFLVAALVDDGEPSFFGVAVVVAGSFLISRLLQGSAMTLAPLRAWGAMLSLLVFYAVVRVDFFNDFAFWDFSWLDSLINDTTDSLGEDSPGVTAVIGVPLLLIVWIRGVLRGQQSMQFEDVIASFALGFGILAAVLAFGALVDVLPRGVELVAVPYVLVGLFAIGLQHASQATDTFEREGLPGWFVAMAAAVLVMSGVASLFVLIDFGTAQDVLAAVAYGIGWVAAGILTILIWPIFRLLEGAFWLVENVTGGLNARDEPVPLTQVPPEAAEAEEPGGENVLPGWLRDVVRYSVAGLLLATVLGGIAMLFQRFQRRALVSDTRESVYTEGRLVADIGDMIGSLFGRRRGMGRFQTNEPTRRLYFDMLSVAERRGVARQPTDTPLDLEPRLESTFRSNVPGQITRLFDDVRYGGRTPEDETVRRLRAQLDQLQQP